MIQSLHSALASFNNLAGTPTLLLLFHSDTVSIASRHREWQNQQLIWNEDMVYRQNLALRPVPSAKSRFIYSI
jgi:hypothetical protein